MRLRKHTSPLVHFIPQWRAYTLYQWVEKYIGNDDGEYPIFSIRRKV